MGTNYKALHRERHSEVVQLHARWSKAINIIKDEGGILPSIGVEANPLFWVGGNLIILRKVSPKKYS